MEFPGFPSDIYQYKNQFNYSVWTPGTVATLCNVNWDAAYRNIVGFDSEEEKAAYFEKVKGRSGSIRIEGMVYLRYGEPVRVSVPFEVAAHCNYLVVENPAQPVPSPSGATRPTTFYYFINDVRYIAPNTTELSIQLDVWTTYSSRVEFGLCYVKRGHVGIANENCTVKTLRRYLQEPEGFDLGGQTVTAFQRTQEIPSDDSMSPIGEANAFGPLYVIVSSANLEEDLGTTTNPNLDASSGSDTAGICTGCRLYACTPPAFKRVMQALSTAPWVSQCILSVYVVPNQAVPVQLDGNATEDSGKYFTVGGDKGAKLWPLQEHPVYTEPVRLQEPIAAAWYDMLTDGAPPRYPEYSHLKKFWTYPYTTLELSMQNGASVVYKPELLWLSESKDSSSPLGPVDSTRLTMMSNVVPPDVRMVIYPEGYNSEMAKPYYTKQSVAANGAMYDFPQDTGDGIENALTCSNFPQVPITNDNYLNYLASTASQRAVSYRTADWAQQKALAAADTARYNAGLSIYQTGRSAELANTLDNTMLMINSDVARKSGIADMIAGPGMQAVNSVASAGSSIIGGAASGGPAGAAAAAMSTGPQVVGDLVNSGAQAAAMGYKLSLSLGQMADQNAATIANRNAQTGLSQDVAGRTMDANYELASMAAQGDYANAIASIQAKVQDMEITPPSNSGAFGGSALNMAYGIQGWLLVKWRTIGPEQVRVIGDYWLRYGYAINRYMVPTSLRCMEKFSYWQMANCEIVASDMPEVFKETIRGIFEKGATVWADPDLVGYNHLYDNPALPGISY